MNQVSPDKTSLIDENDQRLIEYVAERHLEPGGLNERHVRTILRDRIFNVTDFENQVWPKFLEAVDSFKKELVHLR